MCLLCKDSGKQSHYCPTEETSVCCGVTPVKEGVMLLTMSMQVAIYPNGSVEQLKLILHHQFSEEHFGVVFLVRINPLSVEVDTRD